MQNIFLSHIRSTDYYTHYYDVRKRTKSAIEGKYDKMCAWNSLEWKKVFCCKICHKHTRGVERKARERKEKIFSVSSQQILATTTKSICSEVNYVCYRKNIYAADGAASQCVGERRERKCSKNSLMNGDCWCLCGS